MRDRGPAKRVMRSAATGVPRHQEGRKPSRAHSSEGIACLPMALRELEREGRLLELLTLDRLERAGCAARRSAAPAAIGLGPVR